MSGVNLKSPGAGAIGENGLSLAPAGKLEFGNVLGDLTNTGKLLNHRQLFMNGYSISFTGDSYKQITMKPDSLQVDASGGWFAGGHIRLEPSGSAGHITLGAQSIRGHFVGVPGGDDAYYLNGCAMKNGMSFINTTQGLWTNYGNLSPAGGGVRYYASINGAIHDHIWYNQAAEHMRLIYQDFGGARNGVLKLSVNGIETAAPNANGAGLWRTRKVIAGAAAVDAANYVEVMIDDVLYKLALVV